MKEAVTDERLAGSSDTSGTPRELDARLEALLVDQAPMVDAWLDNKPGTWGKLAAAGVLLERRALGRSLTDAERREVWRLLWALLEARRAAGRCPRAGARQ